MSASRPGTCSATTHATRLRARWRRRGCARSACSVSCLTARSTRSPTTTFTTSSSTTHGESRKEVTPNDAQEARRAAAARQVRDQGRLTHHLLLGARLGNGPSPKRYSHATPPSQDHDRGVHLARRRHLPPSPE